MKKIPTLFRRDPDTQYRYVTNELNTGCEWVAAGEGVPTRKYDGTCVLVRDGKMFRRREVKAGKPSPDGFEQIDEDPDTGKRVGWVPVLDVPADRWHAEAVAPRPVNDCGVANGTYELCGPKVQGNPEGFIAHFLISHADAEVLPGIPTDFEELRRLLTGGFRYEGIVWHHPDGRMAKIKVRDFPRNGDVL